MIRVAGYGRMSTDKQQMSPEVQRQMVQEWFNYQTTAGKWDEYGGAEFVGMFVDEAVSSSIDLLDRPVGQHLFETLEPGDIIVVAKYNRAFRSAADCERTLAGCDKAGLKFCFLDLQIDTSTANGKMLAGILASVSKHERDLRGESTRETMQMMRRQGRPVSYPPFGYTITGPARDRKFAPSVLRRRLAYLCRALLREGYTVNEVFFKLRPHFKTYGLCAPLPRKTLTTAAARACLDFPIYTDTELTKLVGQRVNSVGFVRLPDEDHDHHKQLIKDYRR